MAGYMPAFPIKLGVSKMLPEEKADSPMLTNITSSTLRSTSSLSPIAVQIVVRERNELRDQLRQAQQDLRKVSS